MGCCINHLFTGAGAGEAEAEKQPPAKAPLKFQELEETLENLREQEENMDVIIWEGRVEERWEKGNRQEV